MVIYSNSQCKKNNRVLWTFFFFLVKKFKNAGQVMVKKYRVSEFFHLVFAKLDSKKGLKKKFDSISPNYLYVKFLIAYLGDSKMKNCCFLS